MTRASWATMASGMRSEMRLCLPTVTLVALSTLAACGSSSNTFDGLFRNGAAGSGSGGDDSTDVDASVEDAGQGGRGGQHAGAGGSAGKGSGGHAGADKKDSGVPPAEEAGADEGGPA